MQKKIQNLFLILITLTLLSGCSSGFKPKENTLLIEKDKPILQAVFFEKDIDKNTKKALVEEIQKSINIYSADSQTVKINNIKSENDIERLSFLILEYASIKDFGSFNQLSIFNGSLDEAEKLGFTIPDSYYMINDSDIDTENTYSLNAISLDGCQILILDSDMQPITADNQNEALNYVELKGSELLYATDNVIIKDKHTVAVKADNDKLAFIIYK